MKLQTKVVVSSLLATTFFLGTVGQAFALDGSSDSGGLLNTSLPIPETTPNMVPAKLQGQIIENYPDPFSKAVDDLVAAAEQKNDEQQKFNTAVEKYSSWKNRMYERGMDALNYSLLFKGVSPSSEGGDIVLGEKLKLKSLAAAKYLKQKTQDDTELKVLSDVFQIAMGLGNADQTDGEKQIEEAKADLSKLVGAEAADKAVAELKAMPLKDGQTASNGKPLWSIAESQKRMRATIQTAAQQDPIVDEIKADVHHFNNHSHAVMVAHRVVRVTLSAVSLCPNLVGPAAQVVLFGYLVLSGGTEQEKLMKELYLDKRLSSRATLISEEAHMAFENYQLASLTQNKVLMTVSERLINRLTNGQTTARVLCTGEFIDTSKPLEVTADAKAATAGSVAATEAVHN